jgi:serine/threonine protein kinase/tetratricopeptide (TPR) repeat protein
MIRVDQATIADDAPLDPASTLPNSPHVGATEEWSVPAASGATSSRTWFTLAPGTIFGKRYEILKLLGQGGMGAVYKAIDREVDRLVALKVIRPELAAIPEILHRFKQELVLARQVTHKNVIRIYELGEAAGTKFITMEYIEGQDLSTLIKERGKLSIAESVQIMEQVCLALEAAHAEGVVHRDLKPQNIMMDAQGKAYVMDFGIARSTETPGMTRTGAVLGTPDYMSPEQVLGKHVDALSDLYTMGIIFYQLLTGVMPFQADTVVASMLIRTQERPHPATDVDPAIPKALSDMVSKCLEFDPKQRYQSATETLQDLRSWRSGTAVAVTASPPKVTEPPRSKWAISGTLAAVLVLALLGTLFRGRIFSPSKQKSSPASPSLSLAILPFQNASGDPSLDWLGSSMAEMLSTDIGRSSHLRDVSSERVGQILRDLRISANNTFDAPTLRRLAETSNADTVVWGQYAKTGGLIRFDATVQNLKLGRSTALKAEASGEKEILAAIDNLAGQIRQNLGVAPDILRELREQSFKPSSNSLAALRNYNEGLQLARQGINSEAAKRFAASTKEDPEFALAYSQLAQIYTNLGQDNEAEQYSRKSLELSEKLPDREKYLIQAHHNEILKNFDKAIDAYEHLAKISPGNADVLFDLGRIQESVGAFDKARATFATVLALDPKRVDAVLAAGRVEIEIGNVPAGLDYLTRAQSLAIEFDNEEEKAKILQAFGVAYSLINKQEEALHNYQESLQIKRRLGLKKGIADSLQAIAQTESALGKTDAALKDYKEALRIRRDIGDKAGTGDVLNDLALFYSDHGKYDDAMKLYRESLQIQISVGNENNRALALNNIGMTYLQKGDYGDAQTYFAQSLAIREKLNVPADIADTVHNMAETSVRTARYDQALAQYMRALELRRSVADKRGAAVESCALGALFGYQARFGAALSSEEEAVKTLRESQEQGFFMTEAMNEYGKAQAQIGRGEEARKTLEEALNLARGSDNQTQIAQVLNNLGDNSLYQGDFKSASSFYQQAQQAALRTGDRHLILLTKANLAILSARQDASPSVANTLRNLAVEADSLGMKYLSLECSLYLAQALIHSKRYPQASEELLRTLNRSEKLGLRSLSAQCHYFLARCYQLSGKPKEAVNQLSEARRVLEEIHKEAGTNTVLARNDLALISSMTVGP